MELLTANLDAVNERIKLFGQPGLELSDSLVITHEQMRGVLSYCRATKNAELLAEARNFYAGV